MPTYKLTIEYEGTRYSGWQTQTNTAKTVQGYLIRAAKQTFNDADLGGAGRTDSGVHAAGQVAHLRLRAPVTPIEITRKLNDLLPHDIQIVSTEPAGERFHARHDAELRVYLYQISTRRSGLAKNFIWWIKDRLDVEKMTRAAALLEGMHDFSNFTDKRLETEETRVNVEGVQIGVEGSLILFRIAASHFLWKMVRKTIAALADVGRGSMTVEEFRARLDGPANPLLPTAPPSGLFLEAVTYGDEIFERPLQAIIPVSEPLKWQRTKKS